MTDVDDSIRRAAVLLTCLEEADARALLERLGSAPADRLRKVISVLGPVAPPERENVMRAFLLSRPSLAERHAQATGVELHEDLARRLSEAEGSRHADDGSSSPDEPSQDPFAFLLTTEAEIVAPFLARENPQTIAVVLSFLQRRQAAELLQRLGPDVQRQVLTRLAKLDAVDPASIDVVAAELRSWLARQRQTPSPPGKGTLVRDVLAGGGDRDREQLMAEFQQTIRRDEVPAHSVSRAKPAAAPPSTRPRTMAFHELVHLSSEDLLKVLRAAPQEMLTLALAGADEQLIDRLASLLPRREGRALRRGIQLQGPTRLADIEDAQRRIATVAMKILAEQGSAAGLPDSARAVSPLAAHWA